MIHARLPRLHLIGPLDGVVDVAAYPEIAGRAATGGRYAVHVRLPGASGGDVLNLARAVRSKVDGYVLVNDRVDVAQLIEADGVHLGERSLPVAEARRLLGDTVLIGRSVHDVAGARRAEADGADYVIAGHVFDTDSKRGMPGRGLEWLAELASAVDIPVIAIGGITVDRVGAVVEAGAWGIAVGRELLAAADPAQTAERLEEAILAEIGDK